MSAYYNENDPKAAAWLRELIKRRLIAPGTVDERDIRDVRAADLSEFRQCHFFAGIGGWSYALRLAGWSDEKEVWTGSCPCQPFSVAGKKQVDSDERHLWPAFRALIAQRKPPVVFGEQVASKDGRIWLAGVRTDLEALGYALGAADLCAAGISAPMVSQRLHWVASPAGKQMGSGGQSRIRTDKGSAQRVGSSNSDGRKSGCETSAATRFRDSPDSAGRIDSRVATPNRYHEHWWSGPLQVGRNCIEGEVERSGRKYRAQWRIKPGLSLLADGVPGRVAQLCGFGNAIVPWLAAEFIAAFMEI